MSKFGNYDFKWRSSYPKFRSYRGLVSNSGRYPGGMLLVSGATMRYYDLLKIDSHNTDWLYKENLPAQCISSISRAATLSAQYLLKPIKLLLKTLMYIICNGPFLA